MPVAGDTEVESNQDFKLRLSDVVNATMGDAVGLGIIIDDDAGGGPVSLGSKSVKATQVLCRRRRPCAGLLTRWNVLRPGTIKVDITASMPAKAKKGKSSATRFLRLARRTVSVKRGNGSVRVKVRAGKTSNRLLRKLRAAKASKVRVIVTFTNKAGQQQVTRFDLPLSL